MSDEVELIAEEIYRQHPVNVEGVGLDWDHVIRSRPKRAAVYREAARNRPREADAMGRLNGLKRIKRLGRLGCIGAPV